MPVLELIDRLRAWSHARQRLGNPAHTPEEALRAVVAVYATHPTYPLGLAARTGGLTAERYRRIDGNGTGLRIPAMRKTLFLVPREHAALVFTAARQSSEQALRSLRRYGLPTEDYGRIAELVLAAAQEPVRSQELQAAAGLKGDRLGAVLRCLPYEGRLLALAGESLLSSPHRYVAAHALAPEGLDGGGQAHALAWLAGEYLRAYGPARVADFAWWAGIGKRAAGRALEHHDTVDVGDGLLLPAADETAFARVKPLRGTVDLLPKWDAYTMAYAPDGRRRLAHPDVQRRVYTPTGTGLPGDGNPVVLVDGEVAGLWSFGRKGGTRAEPFDTFGPAIRGQVDRRLEALAALLVS